MAESYVRFAQKVFNMETEALFTEYPQLGDCIVPDDPNPSATAETLASLVTRHCNCTIQVLRDQVGLAASDLVPQSLPETCLIRLAQAGDAAVYKAPDLPDITLSPKEEEESRGHKFRSDLIIQVTGLLENRRSNEVRTLGIW